LKEVCPRISDRYEISFIEIGTNKDHVHSLIQSVSMYSPTKIIQMVKRKQQKRYLDFTQKFGNNFGGVFLD